VASDQTRLGHDIVVDEQEDLTASQLGTRLPGALPAGLSSSDHRRPEARVRSG
jgi:hypothetical protein